MIAALVDVMGDDLRVVNAARVSFNKESDWVEFEYEAPNEFSGDADLFEGRDLSTKDQKLIKYLADHNHWTPFSHVVITMREKVPIFVARQRFKHMVGFTYNEVSRRYVDDTPEFYEPEYWRYAPENAKQGSGGNIVDENGESVDFYCFDDTGYSATGLAELATMLYSSMIKKGVAPEQARMVLPQSMYTEYYVTGSLAAWARAYKLRSDPHAQKEIQDLAVQWNEIISEIEGLKYSWKALTNGSKEA